MPTLKFAFHLLGGTNCQSDFVDNIIDFVSLAGSINCTLLVSIGSVNFSLAREVVAADTTKQLVVVTCDCSGLRSACTLAFAARQCWGRSQ